MFTHFNTRLVLWQNLGFGLTRQNLPSGDTSPTLRSEGLRLRRASGSPVIQRPMRTARAVDVQCAQIRSSPGAALSYLY
jgi:hypothetical protein